MLIECRARRKARDPRIGRRDSDVGSKSTLFNKTYHFKPREGSGEAHVCEVTDKRAIARLLSIAEQYNQHGHPPRVPPSRNGLATGQPAVVTEFLDDGDELGTADAPKRPIHDPHVRAKRIFSEWVDEQLQNPVKQIQKNVADFTREELDALLVAEREGQQRKTVINALQGHTEVPAAPPEPEQPAAE